MENTNSEVEVKNIRAYDKNVHGCIKHGKDVMIAFNTHDKGYTIKDLFLNQDQAEFLLKELFEAVSRNKEDNAK